jgi:lysozyme
MSLLGIDSSGSNLHGANFAQVKAAGYSFVYIRATDGTWQDPDFAKPWADIKAAGLVRGAYMFFRPAAAVDPQLKAFTDVVGHLGPGELPPILDIEFPNGGRAKTGPSIDVCMTAIRAAVAGLRAFYKTWPILYTSWRVWTEDLLNAAAADLTECQLSVARYAYAMEIAPQPTPTWEPPVPVPWGIGDWTIHQFQGDAIGVPGIDGRADLNRFNTMSFGAHGARVGAVQKRLARACTCGTTTPTHATTCLITTGVTVDNDYGLKTVAAMKTFQASRGLVADGVLGIGTDSHLAWV